MRPLALPSRRRRRTCGGASGSVRWLGGSPALLELVELDVALRRRLVRLGDDDLGARDAVHARAQPPLDDGGEATPVDGADAPDRDLRGKTREIQQRCVTIEGGQVR